MTKFADPFDLVIVGAGPAGITIAKEFAQHRAKSVCLVESGGLDFSAAAQELSRGESVGLFYGVELEGCRYRRFGGSMNARYDRTATPALIAMSPLDFEKRPWVPFSGWPFAFSDLSRHFQHARALTGIRGEEENWETEDRPFLPFDPAHLRTCVWQGKPGFNFGREYLNDIRQAANIRLLLDTTVVEILTEASDGRATGVRAVGADGSRFDIAGKVVVLACGGIENARMLLLSTSSAPAGLGNGHDLVGRFFMEHPHVSSASLHFTGSRRWEASYKSHVVDGIGIRPGICLSEDVQKRQEVLNYSAIVVDEFLVDASTHAVSPGYVALKELVARLAGRDVYTPGDFSGLGTILADGPAVVRGLINRARGRNGAIFTRSEQAPNPESRVTLSEQRDRLGLRKVRLDWRLTDADKRTIRVAVAELEREFSRLGLGKVIPQPWLVEDEHSWPPWVCGGDHHIGTTRMANSPREGVVDPNCQVFGVTNLYVAGSSVFPTGGFANSTLTLVALAHRLAEHLVAKLESPEAVIPPGRVEAASHSG
jgi:choline dehydrogenase-like flavoprotein